MFIKTSFDSIKASWSVIDLIYAAYILSVLHKLYLGCLLKAGDLGTWVAFQASSDTIQDAN